MATNKTCLDRQREPGPRALSHSTLYRNYCLTRRSVSIQEEGWGADRRRVKRETARPDPIAFGSVVAESTRDSSSEISVEEIVAGGATVGSGVSPKIGSRRTATGSCTRPGVL